MEDRPCRVLVDENYHYQDVDERYELGAFATCEQAMGACRRIVDEFLHTTYRPGMTGEELWRAYVGFGEDPFVVSADPACRFSAWTYARERCRELAGG